MKSFFAQSDFIGSKPLPVVPQCGACGLYRDCTSPKMEIAGEGNRKVLIVGEAPGADEDDKGRPFVGRSGTLLKSILQRIGVDMSADCWLTNALICRPQDNATPTTDQLIHCHPNLVKALKQLEPVVVILLGGPAIESFFLEAWPKDIGAVGRWAGWNIPFQPNNVWVCPTYHPSYVLRAEGKDDEHLIKKIFTRHLKRAFKHTDRPWDEVPDYRSRVQIIHSPNHAAEWIWTMMSQNISIAAFDYETNALKPHAKGARVYSCSIAVADHNRNISCIAFPWHGKAIKATGDFLQSNVPKVAANLKFEEAWTRKEFKRGVKNWKWDVVIVAHWLDNRRGITGLKFQALTKLGFPLFNQKVEPFLIADTAMSLNRIDQIGLDDLLLYNGLDSVLELELAFAQGVDV